MLEKSEAEQLDKAWTITRIIWGALIGSLAVYLLVCKIIEDQLKLVADFPLETMKVVFLGIAVVTFFVTASTMTEVAIKVPRSQLAEGFSSLTVREIKGAMDSLIERELFRTRQNT